MSYNSEQLDKKLVAQFKAAFRPTINLPLTPPERLALAEALEQLAHEIRTEATQI